MTLLLNRYPGQKIQIGNSVSLEVRRVKGNRVLLAFEAPDAVAIRRAEVLTGDPCNLELYKYELPDEPGKPVIFAGSPEDLRAFLDDLGVRGADRLVKCAGCRGMTHEDDLTWQRRQKDLAPYCPACVRRGAEV